MLDFFLKLLEGTTHSLWISFQAVLLCVPFSIVVAIFLRKETQLRKILLYALDVFIALPNQVLLLTLAGVLGGGSTALLLSVFVTQVPGCIRHFKVHFSRAYGENHVEAAKALGAGRRRVFFRHVLPRLWAPLSIYTLSLVKRVILMEALLTFLGLGFDPLSPSLGRLISEGRDALFLTPIYFLAPVGILILCLYILQSVSDRFSLLFRSPGLRYL
jgi:ABC-type dipeptide/oligopeptide/nickel transport system permease subunit